MSDEERRQDAKENAGGGRKPYRGQKMPYRGNGNRVNDGKKAFGGERSAFGGGKPQTRGAAGRPAGNRPAFGGTGRAQSGDRSAIRGEQLLFAERKSPCSGEMRNNEGRNPAFRGNRRPDRAAKPSFDGSRRPDGAARPSFGGNRRPEGAAKPSFDGNRRPEGAAKPSFDGSRRPEGATRPSFDGSRRPDGVARPSFDGNRRPDGAGKPSFGGRSGGPRGERPAFRGQGRPVRGEEKPVTQTDGLPARRIALAVIRAVTEQDAYASLVLDEKLRNCGLSVADRRLAARLAYDTIEHLLTLDHALNQIMAKQDTDIKLRNVLRLGACQLLLEDRIPESAATNTSVALCKEIGMEGLAGVCNGILRNLIRQKDELSWPDPVQEPAAAMSIRHSVPVWLVEKLTADYGDDAERLMGYHVPETYVTIRPNLTLTDEAAFAALMGRKVWDKEPGLTPGSWRIRGMVDIGRDADFLGGRFSIQGEGSMMACMAAEVKPGMQVLDACAAPGGKTCLMAEMMNGTGRVQAWELHPHRTELIAAQAKRLHLENIRPMTRDATRHREELDQTMDVVLLDAPCSGLGVMADKPDVKYRVTESSLAELTQTQAALLDAVATYVKRGGRLVYSTCSMLKEENVRQVEAFLVRHPEFELAPLPESIPERFRQYADVGLQLLPYRDQVEGFYICPMRRKRV